jgi:hypothetical protein
MRNLAALFLAGLLLSACVDGPSPAEDVANYDALKSAKESCAAKGGELQLRDQGNPERISSFVCKRK